MKYVLDRSVEAEQCEMVSADDAFVRKMKAKFPFLVRLADLP